jgi:hypothetical protein
MEKRVKTLLMSLAFFIGFNVDAEANLVTNGSFESFSVDNGAYIHIADDCDSFKGIAGFNASCSTNGQGWLAVSPVDEKFEYLEVRNNLVGTAQEGVNFVELNPASASAFQQSFSAAVGTGHLSWFDRGRNNLNFAYEVYLNGQSIFGGSTGSESDWTFRSFNEVNLLENNTITFKSLSNSDLGANLDNVSLTQNSPQVGAVPEAKTFLLMLVGFLMFGFLTRRHGF